MKCFVLAGGAGDRLWPLSRKNYPKQFMAIRENRSMFQETIARNLPLCDEFFIITSEKYRYIAEGQLLAFQGIKYRLIFEEVSLKTAPAVLFCSLLCKPEDEILIVATDHIIEGSTYTDCIMRAKEIADSGNISVVGILANRPATGYGYIRPNPTGAVADFRENASLKEAVKFTRIGGYYWDAGIILAKAGVLNEEYSQHMRDLYCKTRNLLTAVDTTLDRITLHLEMQSKFTAISFGDAIIKTSNLVRIVPGDFYWNKIIDFRSFYTYVGKKFDNRYIEHKSKNISVINRSSDKLVVVNGVKDLMVVNTDDAVYITREDTAAEIKTIISEHYEGKKSFFDDNRTYYLVWGTKEYLSKGDGYCIKKITVYPGKTITGHAHSDRSDHWTIVKGVATIQIKGKGEKDYPTNYSVIIPQGVFHQVTNKTTEDIVIIESSVVKVPDTQPCVEYREDTDDDIIHLTPIFKDYLWGGTRIRDVLKKPCDIEPIAESWELSTHPAGQCSVTEGKYKGMLFRDYVEAIGRERLGWKCQPFKEFPLMIKFIDAKENLSIQVHPDDDYALTNENEYGKNEMWYILDAEPDAYIYLGFNRKVTPEEIRRRIENETLTEVLNKVPVKKGQTYFLRSGTVHAIGSGIFICEIQQSSDATYRLYDYGRRDKNGQTRALHIDKALDVICMDRERVKVSEYPVKKETGYCTQVLGECKYFSTKKYNVQDSAILYVDSSSFLSIIITEGEGKITADNKELPFHIGDSFFIPAGKKSVKVEGRCEFLATQI